jgi:NADH-quinone oxidoreductase subunit M
MLAGLFDARPAGGDRPALAVVAAVSILLSAWYVLTMLQRVFFNPVREPPAVGPEPPRDVNRQEALALGGLAAVCLLLGLFPQVLIRPMKGDVAVLNSLGELARDRVAGRWPDQGQRPSPGATEPAPGPQVPEPKGKEPPQPKTKGGGPKQKGGGGKAPNPKNPNP